MPPSETGIAVTTEEQYLAAFDLLVSHQRVLSMAITRGDLAHALRLLIGWRREYVEQERVLLDPYERLQKIFDGFHGVGDAL